MTPRLPDGPGTPGVRPDADMSTNEALHAAGYTTAPSPSYGLKRVFKDGIEVGHFDCRSAWDLPGMREATHLDALDARNSGSPSPDRPGTPAGMGRTPSRDPAGGGEG